jgi:hypothetical protein
MVCSSSTSSPLCFMQIRKVWVRQNTTDLCILFIMPTTTCFGRCRPSSGHKLYHEGKLYRLKVLVVDNEISLETMNLYNNQDF